MKRVKEIRGTIKHVSENLSYMLHLSWKSDKAITSSYFFVSGIGAFFPITASYLYKLLVDQLIAAQGISVTIPLVLVAILGARYLLDSVQDIIMGSLRNTYLDILLRNRLQNALNYEFYKKISSLDIQHLEDPKTQDLATKASDTFTWRPPDFVRRSSYIFTNIIEYLLSFIILIPFGLIIPAVVTLVALPQMLIQTKISKLQWSIYGSGAPEVRMLWYFRWLLSDRTAIYESKIFQSRDVLLKRFKKTQKYLYDLNKKPLDDFIKIAPLPLLFEGLVVFILAVWKLPLVLSGQMSVGDFTFFVSLLSRMVGSTTNLVSNFGLMYENNLYVDHYLDVIRLPELVKHAENPVDIPSNYYPPKVEFKNVSFTYPGSKQKVLRDISFTIEPHQNIAIVGPNGAGKTTIVKLICRFYDPNSGEILINGVNIKDIDINDWYKYLGTLFQEFVQYNFTVRDNIMLGNPKVKDEKLMKEAAEKSGAKEFIEKLPSKYNQMLGRRFKKGEDLSKGQWQKLAIARTFYEGAPILILDEPTSAIDAEAEYEIFKNLNKFYKDKTLFLISHRFSTVRNANKIIVLDKGRIVEEGDHEQLLTQEGLYSRMFTKQAKGYK